MALSFCQICGEEFYIRPNHLIRGWGKYCSKKCQAQSQLKGKVVSCFICNKEVYKPLRELNGSKSKNYFCSRSCQTKWRNKVFSGARHSNWKSGKSTYRNILLSSEIERKCLLCKITDSRVLNVHHKDHNRTNNNLSNLVWLCMNCHYLVHHSSDLDGKMRK